MTADDERALLAAGHELGNLTPDEEAAYQAWLAEDPEHRDRVAGLADAAAAVRADTPRQTPDPALKDRILAQIAVTPQRPPAAGHPRERAGRTATDAVQPRSRGRRPPAPRRKRLVAGLAAVLAAAVLFAGGLAVGFAAHPAAPTQQAQQQAQAQELARIAAAPDARRATSPVAGGGSATLIWSDSLGASAIVTDGVAPAPTGRTYQLWYIRDGHATSAGLMPSTGARPWAVLTGSLRPGDTVGMTVEPAGGSSQPTTKPVAVLTS